MKLLYAQRGHCTYRADIYILHSKRLSVNALFGKRVPLSFLKKWEYFVLDSFKCAFLCLNDIAVCLFFLVVVS